MVTVQQLLDLEREHPSPSWAKYDAIHALGLSQARFYQLLHRAAGSLEGQAYDPVTAHRILRLITANV